MDLRKTRLWGDSLQSMVELANEGRASGEHPKPLERKPEPKLTRVAKANGTLVGHFNVLDLCAPTRTEHSTRLLPIESVLLAERGVREAKERQEQKPPVQLDSADEQIVLPTNGLSAPLLRRALIVVMVLAIGGLKFYARKAPQPAVASAAVQSKPEDHRPVEKPPAGETRERVAPTIRQRAALDALASGDYPAAHHAYVELARGTQGRSAYSEAARILQERLQQTAGR
jgi:hypothetical protein